jgi:hypothetical protein
MTKYGNAGSGTGPIERIERQLSWSLGKQEIKAAMAWVSTMASWDKSKEGGKAARAALRALGCALDIAREAEAWGKRG